MSTQNKSFPYTTVSLAALVLTPLSVGVWFALSNAFNEVRHNYTTADKCVAAAISVENFPSPILMSIDRSRKAKECSDKHGALNHFQPELDYYNNHPEIYALKR